MDIKRGKLTAPWKWLMYGTPGIGKTTFAASTPAPLFLATEAGTNELDVARVEVGDYATITEAIESLTRDAQGFGTVVVDTVDALEAMLTEHVCRENKWDNIESPGYGKGYVPLHNEWGKFLVLLDRLARVQGLNMLLLGHVHVKKYTPPDSEPYDRFDLKLSEKASARVREWADAVLFARHEVVVSQVKGESRKRGFATGDRVLHTVEAAAYSAKNRYGLPDPLKLTEGTYAQIDQHRRKDHRADMEALLKDADSEKAAKIRTWFETQANKSRALEIIKAKLAEASGKAA